jgi:hypothetical protein
VLGADGRKLSSREGVELSLEGLLDAGVEVWRLFAAAPCVAFPVRTVSLGVLLVQAARTAFTEKVPAEPFPINGVFRDCLLCMILLACGGARGGKILITTRWTKWRAVPFGILIWHIW